MLGKVQHGHMEAVGYDLYCKMLSSAVKAEKGDEEVLEYNVEIDIDIDAYIPDTYIKSGINKLDIYKRISEMATDKDYDSMIEELVDRFGEIPKSVLNLMYVAKLKYNAGKAYVTKISQNGDIILISMYNKAKLNPDKIPGLVEKYYPEITFSANPTNPEFVYDIKKEGSTREKTIQEKLLTFLVDLQDIRDDRG